MIYYNSKLLEFEVSYWSCRRPVFKKYNYRNYIWYKTLIHNYTLVYTCFRKKYENLKKRQLEKLQLKKLFENITKHVKQSLSKFKKNANTC